VTPRTQRRAARPAILTPPPLPNWQALLTPVVANIFQDISISVALWVSGAFWHPIHVVPNVIAFESEHGVEERRHPYNAACLAKAGRERRLVRGQFAGFHDVFVPVHDESGVRGIFVAGPIATARPTSADVLERWHALAGSPARVSDPVFLHYLSMTLATLTLEGPLFGAFERLMESFAGLVAGQGAPQALAAESALLREKLLGARSAERHWDATRSMVNERTAHSWFAFDMSQSLARLGLRRVPQHVVVGLLRGRGDEVDPVDDRLRRDAFQRACVATAQKLGDMLCGQVGDHGILFLVDDVGSAARTRAKLADLGARAAETARRFGLRLHVGIDPGADAGLPARYRSALAAAEMALSSGVPIVHGERRSAYFTRDLRKLRATLGESLGERIDLLSPRFDRYVEAVLVHAGYRLEPVRAQLDAGLERLAEPLLATGALDEKSFDAMCTAMERAAQSASTVTDLVTAYRTVVSDVQSAIQSPTRSRRERAIRRAVVFMREHAGEPLTRTQVARAAGFAPDYFGRLFSRTERITFERYLQQLRVARAQQMLSGTSLRIDAVSQLSGFKSRVYFHRVFKQAVGVTPIAFRQRGLRARLLPEAPA
jgi:AraC-like DNA-binding protein